MSKVFRKLALSLAVALVVAGPLVAQEDTESLGLEMEPVFGEQSLEKIADGSASVGQSRLTAQSASPAISFPIVVAGAIAFALAGFAIGFIISRRKPAAAVTEAPVSLWLDAEKLQGDLQQVESELLQQQKVHEELSADREQLLVQHADQVHELRGEKAELERELNALRLRDGGADGTHDLIDELRAEIEQLRGADDEAPVKHESGDGIADSQGSHDELERQRAHIAELELLLRSSHDENESLEERLIGRETRLDALEETLISRDADLEKARNELSDLREKARLLDEKESRVSDLDAELSSLRNEMNELLGKTGQYQVIVPELENKLFHRQEQIGALESDLQATADEVTQRKHDAKQWQAQVSHLQKSLDAAESHIVSLENDLTAALDRNQLLSRDPATEELHQEVLMLRRNLADAELALEKAQPKLDAVELHSERVDQWNSTVETLQAEIRRKSTLIDSQADHLADSEHQNDLLRAEIEDLRKQLVARNDLLEEAGNVVVSLRDEMDEGPHAATRLRLAQNPSEDPFGDHDDSVDPLEADIEALRFTARSRRDLGDSLETILAEERQTLEQASRRVSARDEEAIELKNELSANRLAMVALQARLNELSDNGEDAPAHAGMDPVRVERELQQSMRVLEALRSDLHKWRGRVKPLHEALVARNERIHALESEIAALRHAQGLDPVPQDDGLVDNVAELLQRTRDGESPEDERARTLDEMKRQWDRIVQLETELADTGATLARVLELDDARCRQIESLEMARAAQIARFAELRTELSAHGIDPDISSPEPGTNVVDLGARRP